MNCRITDLRDKEVIDIKTGLRLGCVCDVEVDTCNAQIISIIVFGKGKFGGLWGRCDDIVIPWCDIEVIGEDTILVKQHHHDEVVCEKCRRTGGRNIFKDLIGGG